jgi:dTDP-4-dehydrorhamnose 3,5-epimerase
MKNDFTPEQGNISGSSKDSHNISANWEKIQSFIDGVIVKHVANVPKDNGLLTEIFRQDWFSSPVAIDQIFQAVLNPGEISGWHSHQHTVDRLFVSSGLIKTVLFDARTTSPTYGAINEFRSGTAAPTLIIVPSGVWHAVQNISPVPSILINFTDKAYQYNDPDHWRLPIDTDKIPYSFHAMGSIRKL